MSNYAISDIHGCGITFKALLDSLGFNRSDKLFILGDYINRMPNSKLVVDTILKLQADGYQIITLKGNHEEMLLDYLKSSNPPAIFTETLASFDISTLDQLQDKYIDWFESLALKMEFEQYILVHAGLDFNQHDPLGRYHELMWIRDWYADINYQYLGDRRVVHGHEPYTQRQILQMRDQLDENQVLGIDNGCFRVGDEGMGHLCCFDLDSLELHFQKNIDY